MTTTGTRPAVRTWAITAGVAGILANALLLLFFAVDQPWRPEPHGSGWLGTANDVAVLVQFAALVPVAVRLRRGVLLGVPALVSVVALQVALVLGVVTFEAQVYPVTAAIAVAIGWAWYVSRRLPGRAGRIGTVAGVSWFTGLAVALAGWLLPSGSVAQWAVLGLGVVVGLVGFFGFGAWPLWLFEEER